MVRRKREAPTAAKAKGTIDLKRPQDSEGAGALTPAEERDLIRIESRIQAGLSAFFDVAYALMEIKQRRLYRGEFRSFEEYCRTRWEMRRAHAYRLIGAAEICSHLSPMGDIPLPENERQIRPLAGLPEKTAEKAWKCAWEKVGAEGKVTGALVEKAVQEVLRSQPGLKEAVEKEDWQVRIVPLLKDALRRTTEGDREGLSEIIERVSLLLLVGTRRSKKE